MRPHWNVCITHFDDKVDEFIINYFSDIDRRCVLVAGAGFDPRSKRISKKLHATLGERIQAILIREERNDPAVELMEAANQNEVEMTTLIPATKVARVQIFDADDSAPVGGLRIAKELAGYQWPEGLTDIVLDVSALSTGIGFPIARYLLDYCEQNEGLNFHVMISSNPEIDARIVTEPYSMPTYVKSFSGDLSSYAEQPIVRIWLPQLATGRYATLEKITGVHGDDFYKVCPILPFPARNPRRADDLIAEFLPLLTAEVVDARDYIYVSERNPLDSFRKISTLKQRYDRTMEGVFTPQLVLSPLGSKVMTVGAMMAAIEHGLPVQHVENLRYDFDPNRKPGGDEENDMTVHIWLHGPIYAGYAPPQPKG